MAGGRVAAVQRGCFLESSTGRWDGLRRVLSTLFVLRLIVTLLSGHWDATAGEAFHHAGRRTFETDLCLLLGWVALE